MNKEKTVAMILLDLCTFACYTDDGEHARGAFALACRLAEEYSLPELEAYRDFVMSLDSGRSPRGYVKKIDGSADPRNLN